MKRSALAAVAALMVLVTGVAWNRAHASKGNPLTSAALSAADEFTVDGEVIERLPAGSYVYLRVVANGEAHWVAALTSLTPKNVTRARVHVFGRANDFHSARLGRDFAELWFAAVQPAVPEGVAP
jgi:hypothetical protein